MKKLIPLLILLFSSIYLRGENFIYNSLLYDVNINSKTAECIGPQNSNLVVKDLVIPDYIIYQGEQYPVISIKENAFSEKYGLTGSLIIGNNVKTIGRTAFFDSHFEGKLTLGNSIESIGEMAFYESRFTGNLIIPNSVNLIKQNAFSGCTGFTGSLIIPDNVEEIEYSAFWGCSGFTSLYIGQNVKKIGDSSGTSGTAFAGCTGLKSIICAAINPPQVFNMTGTSYNFDNKTFSNVPLYLTLGSINNYKVANEWKNFSTIKTIDSQVTSLKLDKVSVTMNVNDVEDITAILLPYYTLDNVEWSVEPTGIVSINYGINELFEEGAMRHIQLKAVKGGKGKLTAICGEYSASCDIIINSPATSITLQPNSLSLTVGDVTNLIATLEPSDTSDEIVWSVSPERIVSIDDGLVTALSVGKAVIKVTAGNVSATCDVEVKEKTISGGQGSTGNWYEDGDENASIHKRIHMIPEEDVDLSTSLGDLSASSWTSGNEDIVEVTRRGIAYAYEYGETVVRAKDTDGKTIAVFEVFVCPTVTVVHGDGVIYTHHVLYNSHPTLMLTAPKGYRIAGVSHDQEDVTDRVSEEGKYIPAEPLTTNAVINIALQDTGDGPTTGADAVLNDPNIRILVDGHIVNIVGVPDNTVVHMYNMKGDMLFNQRNYPNIEVIDSGVYIIEIVGQPNTYKVIIR